MTTDQTNTANLHLAKVLERMESLRRHLKTMSHDGPGTNFTVERSGPNDELIGFRRKTSNDTQISILEAADFFAALRELWPEEFTPAAPPTEPTWHIPKYLVHIRQTEHPREYWHCEHCGKSMTTPERAGAHICDSLKLDRIEAAIKALGEKVNER